MVKLVKLHLVKFGFVQTKLRYIEWLLQNLIYSFDFDGVFCDVMCARQAALLMS
jgi:hypothetical protein